MKYLLSRGLLAASIVGITFFYPLLAPTPHRIDATHSLLIRGGMTCGEVEAIFGVPAGNYDFTTHVASFPGGRWRGGLYFMSNDIWTSRHGVCTVVFDAQGCVADSRWHDVVTDRVMPWQGWWDKLRRIK